jgi:PrtD family type I secretion system ABC transporter
MAQVAQASPNAAGKSPTALNAALKTTRPAFITAITFSFFINLLGLTGSLYMMQVYDRVLTSRNLMTLALLTVLIAFLYMVSASLESLRTRLLVRAGVRFDEEVNAEAFNAVQRASVRQPGPGHTQALRDIDSIREFFTGSGLITFCDVPWVPIYIIAATLLHPWYGILAVATALISATLAFFNDRATRPVLDQATKANIVAHNHALTTFRNAEVLHAMGMVGRLRERWVKHHYEALGHQANASDRAGLLMAGIKFNRAFMQSLILGVGAYLAIQREISPGMMIAASILVGRCIQPIEMAINNWKSLISMRSAFERVQALLRAVPAPGERMRLPDPKGDLSVENLIVRVPGRDVPVLKSVSFSINAGTVLGVIGPSAAGKSSLARALVGVWPAASGAVRLDGSDLTHWDSEELGRFLGYLPQDVELFAGTIAENIARFGDTNELAIVRAAQLAGVHEMIQRLPEGYNTQIGESGQVLSGGQRQRVGLARALYGQPPILVLDEPNASLDAAGEQALMNAIRQLKTAGRTVVIISHKTNSLTLCDAILVLADGAVQAFGPRDEVLARVLGPRIVGTPPAAGQSGVAAAAAPA